MTEAEWPVGIDTLAMLDMVRPAASDRKIRLFLTACCRVVLENLPIESLQHAVEINEQFADGHATGNQLSKARSLAHNAAWNMRHQRIVEPMAPGSTVNSIRYVDRGEAVATECSRAYFVAFMLNVPTRLKTDPLPLLQTDPLLAPRGAAFLRDIFGNPFRPVALDPRWLTSTVVGLAQAIYDERAFDRLPILADALQDAGCEDADVLAHCRGDGPHVRGCWVVDLVLGKQ